KQQQQCTNGQCLQRAFRRLKHIGGREQTPQFLDRVNVWDERRRQWWQACWQWRVRRETPADREAVEAAKNPELQAPNCGDGSFAIKKRLGGCRCDTRDIHLGVANGPAKCSEQTVFGMKVTTVRLKIEQNQLARVIE